MFSHPTTIHNKLISMKPSFHRLMTFYSSMLLFSLMGADVSAQGNFSQFGNSRNFQQAEAIIRVAEPSQLADTVMVWGDIGVSGTYLVPRGTKLVEMISYARGPRGFSTAETQLDWSKLRISVMINPNNGRPVQKLDIHYDTPLDPKMRSYQVQNFDVISLQVRRKAVFTDYFRVIAPVISISLSTAVLLRTWN
jgi:hypothetical protein